MSTTPARVYNVLFLCTHNSARSIMAESLLRRWGNGRFNGFSAGSHPSGTLNPHTIETLKLFNHKTDDLRSKTWDEFAQPGAPALDFVFTVCDQVAAEMCPVWVGLPMTAHWGVEDPAKAKGPEEKVRKAFRRAYLELESRIKIFTNLRMDALDRLTLQARLDQIGHFERSRDEEMSPADD